MESFMQNERHEEKYETEWEKKAREYAAKKNENKNEKFEENANTTNGDMQLDEKNDDVDSKIQALKNQLLCSPMNFAAMEKLIKFLADIPGREGELAKAYEMLLNEFPLCFGYWKRLAKLHADKGDFAAADSIYITGLEYLSQNPHYHLSYIKHLVENPHKSLPEIRDAMDRAIEQSGLHWKAFPLWTYVIDFEEKKLKSDDSNEQEKQICFQRLKDLYFGLLRTPLEDSNKSLEKFKKFTSGGTEKNANQNSANLFFFDFFDLLSDEEIIQLLHKLHEKASGSLRKRKLNEKNAASALSSADEMRLMLKIKYMDGKECIWVEGKRNANNTLKDVLAFACENARTKKQSQENINTNINSNADNNNNNNNGDEKNAVLIPEGVCFAYKNKLIGKNEKKLHENILDIFDFSDKKNLVELFFYEGTQAIKKKVESLGSQNAIENLCMEIREDLHQQNLAEYQKRSAFEQKIPRWFFHPDALKPEQLIAWRDYLDFEDNEGNARRISALYDRALEVCCNYVEFWHRRISKYINDKNFDAAENLFKKGCYQILKKRPDMYFEYAEFAESQANFTLAVELLNKVIDVNSGIAPSMVEGWLRMIALRRRMNEYDECKNLFTSAEKHFENKPKCLAILAMEKCLFFLLHTNDAETAMAVLRNEWEKQQDNFSLFKFYVNFCEHRARNENKEENYKLICSIFNQALTDSQMTLLEQLKAWQSFCAYVQRNAFSIRDIVHVKNRAEKFLYERREELAEMNSEELHTLSTKRLHNMMALQHVQTYDMGASSGCYVTPHYTSHDSHTSSANNNNNCTAANVYYDTTAFAAGCYSDPTYAQAYNFYYPYSSATHTNTVYVPSAL